MRELYPNLGKCELLEKNIQDNLVFFTCFIAAIMLLIVINVNSSFAIEFTNYTSNKYQIQFQYPTNWKVIEKTDILDEGAHISINDLILEGAFINIIYKEEAGDIGLLDMRTITEVSLEEVTRDDYSTEHLIVERPSYLSIEGHEAGTFVYTMKNKLEDTAVRDAQHWSVLANNHYYIISFSSTTDMFDSPDNVQIRDQFIKSIKFLK